MHTTSFATQAIQAILAPAVMVSASALFLLGLNARYVALITRIRLLNDERRQLLAHLNQHMEMPHDERDRFVSIEHQLIILRQMTWHIRNSILCQVLAAALFVLTSCLIGIHCIISIQIAEEIAIYLFMLGLLVLLSGVIFLGLDIFKSYQLIGLELDELSLGQKWHQVLLRSSLKLSHQVTYHPHSKLIHTPMTHSNNHH